jgi:hypothetical protein
MTNKRATAGRTLATGPRKLGVVAGKSPAPVDGAVEPASTAATREQRATTSPLRRWRATPRPASWQPGSWGDPL